MSGKRVLAFALPEGAEGVPPEELREYYERVMNPVLLRVRDSLYAMNGVEARDPDRILDIIWDLETVPEPRLLVEIESRKPQRFYRHPHEQGRFAGKMAGVFQIYMEMQGFEALPGPAALPEASERVSRQVFFKLGDGKDFDAAKLLPKLEKIRTTLLEKMGTDLTDPARDREMTWQFFTFGNSTLLQVDISAAKEAAQGFIASVLGSRAERDVKWAADSLRALVTEGIGAKKVPNETMEALFKLSDLSESVADKGRSR